jgi:hypothetical protein
VLSVAIIAAGGSACHKDDAAAVPLAEAVDAQAPREHLADGELLEGTEQAYGLTLPRGLKIDTNLPPQIVASGEPKAADVANYVRRRVAMGSVKVGAASTMFLRVQVPARPGRELTIRVEPRATGTGVQMTIRDVTPPPVDQSLTDEQRWQQVGIAPGGKIADPAHLH